MTKCKTFSMGRVDPYPPPLHQAKAGFRVYVRQNHADIALSPTLWTMAWYESLKQKTSITLNAHAPNNLEDTAAWSSISAPHPTYTHFTNIRVVSPTTRKPLVQGEQRYTTNGKFRISMYRAMPAQKSCPKASRVV